ncbi:ABC1-domain-containing protein [Ascodesmis nigricans]|uniref:ABC1-domain-containing protein n=1 Tax=Ascodesmis nigricans TaxID=341454 RepID=A0A4S2MRR7_9PEZI|nr:ABC1-domain-containing protein [Ascodesmis nigricans]
MKIRVHEPPAPGNLSRKSTSEKKSKSHSSSSSKSEKEKNVVTYTDRHGNTVKDGFTPPPPSSLPKPRPPRQFSPRALKYLRRIGYTTGLVGTLYLTDAYLNYSTFSRNFYAVGVCALIAADYKLNFGRNKTGGQLTALHARAADRILNLCLDNGGLYQKIGQAIAMQSAVLPPVVQQRFAKFFDETPQASFAEVEKVLQEEFGERFPGTGPIADRIFEPGTFEQWAVGSASVAQVHRARLKTGEEVAVKIQKPWIERQVFWDLWAFRQVSYWFGAKMFHMPIDYMAPFICERLYSETDFYNEAMNAQHTASFIESEPTLRGRIHVPKVYPELSTKRVLVAEWIDGIGVAERDILTGPYRDDRSVGHSVTTPKSIAHRQGPISRLRETSSSANRNRVYGLGLREKDIMQTMVDVFCAQMFLFGWVHCDPHPGNILVRRLPNGKPQLVLLDHGLYINTTPEFRYDYALFWKSLLTFDNDTIQRIAEKWGIGNSDLFASATLLRPYQGGTREIATIVGGREAGGPATPYEAHQLMRQKISEFIINQEAMPQELIFIGRNMRIVQGNNQALGAPVNRIKIIANWASYALTRSVREAGLERGFAERVKAWGRHLLFKTVVLGLDFAFWWGKIRQVVWGGMGFEEEMEARMKRVAKEEFGVELQDNILVG